MRKLIIVGVMFCASPGWAQTGSIGESLEPLLPGLVVRVIRETPRSENGNDVCSPFLHPTEPLPWECIGSPPFPGNWGVYGAFTVGVDAAGNAYHVATSQTFTNLGNDRYGNLLRRVSPAGVSEDVAHVIRQVCMSENCALSMIFNPEGLVIDVTGGRILMTVVASRVDALNQTNTLTTIGVVEVSGLPTMFDTLVTFVPSGQVLSALVPAHPDGFRSADSLQLWAGDVRTLPDWSQAQPVTCSAAMSPTPGQVVSVADTLPDPPAGTGRYYVVASHNGAERRLGRQYVNGAFSSRNPAALPICQ
jgi:hypothetical protein